MSDNFWIPKETEQASSDRLVWSTKKIQDLEVALDQGYKPQVKMPFYEGRQFLRRGNIVFEYTDEEIQELARCAADIVYFAEKYRIRYVIYNVKFPKRWIFITNALSSNYFRNGL